VTIGGRILAVLTLFLVALLLRVGLAERQGLWADEIFSLAMATGHSLEHPASRAEPAMGDFVEASQAMPASFWRRYLAHDEPPASPTRVVRAVLLSDTSPPLYYLVLQAWTRGLGTTDRALRLFSVFWALLTLPLLYSLGRNLATPGAAFSTCLLYSLAPVSLYYSVEGRMYSLLWFLATALAWLSLRLHDRGGVPGTVVFWVVTGAAGLLTHYFFLFIWTACVLWLMLEPGRAGRGWVAVAGLATLPLVFPWYQHLPESLAQWRITGHWLDGPLTTRQAITAPVVLGWNLLAGRGPWGGDKWLDRGAAGLFLVLGLVAASRGLGRMFRARRLLIWLWVLAACTGPVAFDLLRGTFTSLIPRYAVAGMPAAMLLVGLALRRFSPGAIAAFLTLVVAAWAPGMYAVFANRSRSSEPYRQVSARLQAWARPSDLVIVHSIPSGVLGVARYLGTDLPIVAWVQQLGRRRVPDDLMPLLRGRERVALVEVHAVGAPVPEKTWLRTHATRVREEQMQNAWIFYFDLSGKANLATGTEGVLR
jgi:mannosyltransferase